MESREQLIADRRDAVEAIRKLQMRIAVIDVTLAHIPCWELELEVMLDIPLSVELADHIAFLN